jgi:hypothetical protein
MPDGGAVPTRTIIDGRDAAIVYLAFDGSIGSPDDHYAIHITYDDGSTVIATLDQPPAQDALDHAVALDRALARRREAARQRLAGDAWSEQAHPRGQPENAGEFGPGGGKTSSKNRGSGSTGGHGVSELGVRPRNPDGSNLVYHWIDKDQADKAIKSGVLKPTFTHTIPGAGRKRGISTGYSARKWNLQDPNRVALVLDRSKIASRAYDFPGNEVYQAAQLGNVGSHYRKLAQEDIARAPQDEAFFIEPIDLRKALIRTLRHNDPEAMRDTPAHDAFAFDKPEFKEEQHPRGQPENAGEFGPGGGKSKRPSRARRAPAEPAASSTSQPASVTDTPAFRQWFGDSKVVDENGKPQVVYHSTTYGDFSEFNKAEQRKGMGGFGFYFTGQAGANAYAQYGQKFQMEQNWRGDPKRVNIMPVYLKMERPLVVDDIRKLKQGMPGLSSDPGPFGVGRAIAGMPIEAKTAIEEAGYDGVITYEHVKPARNGSLSIVEPGTKGAIRHPVYIVFEPTQIKSAIGNRGTFDPKSPSIMDAAQDAFALDKPEFKEEQHPRGQPKNKGEFVKGQGTKGAPKAKAAKKPPQAATPKTPRAKAAKAAPKAALPTKPKVPPVSRTELFASPNIATGLNLRQAQQRIESRRERALAEISGQIDKDLGLQNSVATPVVGVWADGAENSLMIEHDSTDIATERAAAAMKGLLADQKAVLLFHPDTHGPDSMFTFDAAGSLDQISRALLQNNIMFHTLEPIQLGGGKPHSIVHVLNRGHDPALTEAVSRAATQLGGNPVDGHSGTGDFIGATDDTGTDEQQRDEARRAYDAAIQAASQHSGRDFSAYWQNYSDRWRTLVGNENAAGPPGTVARGVINRPPLKGSAGGDPNQISTRHPTNVGAYEDDQYRRADLDAVRQVPETFIQHMNLLSDPRYYPNMLPGDIPPMPNEPPPPKPTGIKAADKRAMDAYQASLIPARMQRAEVIAHNFVEHAKENLAFLYNIAPQQMKDQAHMWYEGAHDIAQRKADQYKLPFQSVAGVYAALSPQKLWDMNVYLGDNLIDIHQTQQNTPWDEKMEATARRLWKSDKLANDYASIRGKTLAQCESAIEKAMWIRTFGEAHIPKNFNSLSPDGQVIGPYTYGPESPKAGQAVTATWQSTVALANAVRCLESGGDRNVISASLGDRHKVRSFFNNILDPHSPNGDVTIDTHAVGAALLRALGGSHVPVMHDLATGPKNKELSAQLGFQRPSGSAQLGITGTYALYAQAYRELAEELKIEPRTLQSVTWEAKRRLLGSLKDGTKGQIEAAWQAYHRGWHDLVTTQRHVVNIAGGADRMKHQAMIDPADEEDEDQEARAA